MASNYQDILDQLRATGLIVDRLDVGRLVRCKIEGDRERRGWYAVHEITTGTGASILVGSCGVWRGDDNGATKLDVAKSSLSAEQRELARTKHREARKRAEDLRKAEARRAAQRAAAAWAKCALDGESDYLARKGVNGHGVRYSPSGALVIPMLDTAGVIHGLQVIRSRKGAKADHRPEKEFWPRGLAKKGHFHLIGVPTWIVLVAEGYATGATLHAATGHPVVIAFDAGNLAPVAQALRARHRGVRILICADDDIFAKCPACGARIVLPDDDTTCPACTAEHKRLNTGVAAASTAAVGVNGAFAAPCFADEASRRAKFRDRGIKLTDFNDLATLESLIVVRNQIDARKSELGWHERAVASTTNATGQGGAALSPIGALSELLNRYALVYALGGTVFDRQEHKLVAQSDLRDACLTRQIYRAWSEHPERCIVRTENVGFDPGGEDPMITCNLWAGWPTTPARGECDKLLDLLRHMCSGDASPEKLYRWVLSWVAFPIQHPGAKMKTALVLHGPQGTGKNMFFEAVMAIYGRYGAIIDQSAIEDRFNDWASRKLFLIADEVIARSDLYHVKNRLKAFITGAWIRINPKGLPAYDERNHVNLVFLSNEIVPVALEEDDRRHAVIWTPEKLPAQFYRDVHAEIAAGGIAALHDHLLHLDIGDFEESTPPPRTDAKDELIDDGLDVVTRFIYAIQTEEIGIPFAPALSTELYKVYKAWSGQAGLRPVPLPRFLRLLKKRHAVECLRKRHVDEAGIPRSQKFCMLTSAQPVGTSEQAWLTSCVAAFRAAAKDYHGSCS